MHPWSILFCLMSLCAQSHAQEAVVCTGGNANGSSGSISFSVGQIADDAHFDSDGSLSEGVQQAYPDLTTTVHSKAPAEAAQVFPTATNDKFNLVLPAGVGVWSVQLYDPHGRLARKSVLPEGIHVLSLQPFAEGHYKLRIEHGNGPIQTFSLIRIANR